MPLKEKMPRVENVKFLKIVKWYIRHGKKMTSLRLLAFMACILLAGCTTSPNDPSAAVGKPGGPPLLGNHSSDTPQVEHIPLSFIAGLGYQSGPLPIHVSHDSQRGGPTMVAANASAILIEARWSCQSPTCRLRVEFEDPEDTDVINEFSDGSFRAGVPRDVALIPGRWDLGLFLDSPIIGLAGEARVSVFYDSPIPDGYTAF